MSINMLGRLPLSEIRGPRDDFEEKLAGEEGELWLEQFKLFLRKEPCWVRKDNNVQPTTAPTAPFAYPDTVLRLRDFWAECWRVVGGQDLAGASLTLPTYQTGFDWPIIKPPGLTTQQVYDLTEEAQLFSCWKYWDTLDVLEVKEEYLRSIARASVVLIRPSNEPDIRMSYYQAIEKRLLFISLDQRILLELFGAWLNRDHRPEAQVLQIPEHLDVSGWTRTSSLDSDGNVANAYWSAVYGNFRVDWSNRGSAYPGAGIRQAVS